MKKEALFALVALSALALLLLLFLRQEPGPHPGGNRSPFSGQNAYDHVGDLVSLGPRTVGSEAIVQAREYIVDHLSLLGLEVLRDGFNSTFMGQAYYMENLIGVVPGSGEEIIALAGHYDTKDIPGANDGGSSAGLLLEMGRVFAQSEWNRTIWLVFFDGEDTGSSSDTMFYGSRHLAGSLGQKERPQWLILVDMVGDKTLYIRRDVNSDQRLLDYVWSHARQLGYGQFFASSSRAVLDDHVPFMEVGVPSCVLIDFNYGPRNRYWHTPQDDMDKISAASLQVVGDVVYYVISGLDAGEMG